MTTDTVAFLRPPQNLTPQKAWQIDDNDTKLVVDYGDVMVKTSILEATESTVPQNLEISSDSYQQRLFVMWNVSESVYKSGMDIHFHIQVSRAAESNIILNEIYSSKLSKSSTTFRWFWDSEVPLECYTHSVRIRGALDVDSLAGDKEWSMWSPWKAHYGKDTLDREKAYIYPHEKTVKEGSNVTFCCIPGKNQNVLFMMYKYTRYLESSAGNATGGIFQITVNHVSLSKSHGTNVICNLSNTFTGTVLYVSRPPDELTNISCETQDLQTLRCSWFPGWKSNLVKENAPKYILYEKFSNTSSPCSTDSCTWPMERNQQMYNFTLSTENLLGKRSIDIVVNVTQRVRPLAPTNLSSKPINARNIMLNWELKADYTAILLLCQTELQMSNVYLEQRNKTMKGRALLSPYSVSLDSLHPYTSYTLRVRCKEASSMSRWGSWSERLLIKTQEDVPTAALDIWREVNSVSDGRNVTLYWKHLPALHANGNILFYNVTWQPLEDGSEMQSKTSPALQNSTHITIGSRAYIISITAQNGAGSSPLSEIRIPPAINDKGIQHIKEERAYSKDDGIYISWNLGHTPYRAYVVDWCNFPRSKSCDLQWKKYNSTIHGAIIKSSAFTPGVRYNFRIYGSNEHGEHLLGKMMGYTKELASSINPSMEVIKIEADAVLLKWDSYPTDENQEGFLIGYKVYIKSPKGVCELNEAKHHTLLDGSLVCMFTISETEKKSFTIKQLRPNTKYEVAVVAVTGGGESPADFIRVQTLPDSADAVISAIVLPVVIISVLALMLLLMGYWKRHWLKDLCYPDIPDPNKSNVLSFSVIQGNKKMNVMTPNNFASQKIDLVKVQEAAKLQMCKDLNHENYQVLDSMYNGNGDNAKLSLAEKINYNSMEDQESGVPYQAYFQPQTPNYLEFFNMNYSGKSEDVPDVLPAAGYKPQTGIPQAHFQLNDDDDDQSSSMDLNQHLYSNLPSPSFSENLTSFTSDDMSPTSMKSDSFLCKD
ncbi:oncostatin-M-specific receptor subunit beta [Rhinophrynus dorsalis]